MVNSNSNSPSRSRLWLASILNPALDADSSDLPARAPASASGRSLRNTVHRCRICARPRQRAQPSRHAGATLHRRRLPAHRGRRSTAKEQRRQEETTCSPSDARSSPPHSRARNLHQLRPREAPRCDPRGPAPTPAPAVQDTAPRIVHLPATPFPPLASDVPARLRPLPSALRARGAWARPPRPARRPGYALPASLSHERLLRTYPRRHRRTDAPRSLRRRRGREQHLRVQLVCLRLGHGCAEQPRFRVQSAHLCRRGRARCARPRRGHKCTAPRHRRLPSASHPRPCKRLRYHACAA
ncbi:hypothetical protein DFH09DRAFT_468276 [Mycena vulgaris]|nr:hypothetical protein DFH09DRAFT_468276 [Mycena vulgaris]